jgi:putative SOS response-associated peptidase YedK
MCGRITQTREIREYARAVGWGDEDFRWHDISGYTTTYNGPPGVKHLVLRQHAGHRVVEMVHWGYTSPWAKEKGFNQAINAKREKLLGSYYRTLMQTGRIIVPAEGWYEWTGPKGQRQPWYVREKNGEPLFLAGLTNHFPDRDDPEGAGFVLVTNDVAGGMIDIRPECG